MSASKTYFLRSSIRNVVQLEINALEKTDPALSQYPCFYLEDRHIQELLELLRDIVVAYDLSHSQIGKKQSSTKQTTLSSGIITGSSLRLGYSFKKKPASQHCLVPSSLLSLEGQQSNHDDDDLVDLHLLPDKLVVYVHLLASGSPQKMAQLVKAVGDRRLSSGISVSSYFKKVPSSQTGSQTSQPVSSSSGSQSTQGVNKTDSQCTDVAVGSRNKIKNILERGHHSKSKGRVVKRQKTARSPVRDENSGKLEQMACKEKSVSNFSAQESSRTCKEGLKDTTKTARSVVSSVASEETSETGRQKNECGHSSLIEGVKITKVNKSVDILPSLDTCLTENTVTQVNVEHVKEGNKLPAFEVNNNCKSEKGEHQKEHIEDIGNIGLNSETDAASQESDIACDKYAMVTSDDVITSDNKIVDSEFATEIALEADGKISDILSDDFNEDSDNDSLPSASFCLKPPTKMSDIDTKELLAAVKRPVCVATVPLVCDLQRFEKTVTEKEEETDLLVETDSNLVIDGRSRVENNADSSINPVEAYKKDEVSKAASDPKKATTRRRVRLKRKLPDFSDTDSDENFVNKKAQSEVIQITATANKPKFVDLSKLKLTSKRLSISKSFFTDDGKKSQPTLTHFLSTRNSNASCETDDTQVEEMEVELIKELSDKPMMKSETDIEMRREIRSLSSVCDLSEKHLRYLVNYNKMYLRNIFAGKIKCERHQMYKKGGRAQRELDFKSCLSEYSEDQVDVVMDSLTSIFCKRHHKYLDYVLKVLLPEMLIRLHMDVHDSSHSDSERQLTL